MSYHIQLDQPTMNSMIEFNKLLKANILLGDCRSHQFIGFGYDNTESGIIKTISMPNPVQYPLAFDMVYMTKDLVALYKESNDTGIPVYAEVDSYYWNRHSAIRLYCGDDTKACFPYSHYIDSYHMFMDLLSCSKEEFIIKDLRSHSEFDPMFAAKAADGIIPVNVCGYTIFTIPMFLGALKADIVDLEVHSYGGVLICIFTIHKKKGIEVKMMYRFINMNHSRQSL